MFRHSTKRRIATRRGLSRRKVLWNIFSLPFHECWSKCSCLLSSAFAPQTSGGAQSSSRKVMTISKRQHQLTRPHSAALLLRVKQEERAMKLLQLNLHCIALSLSLPKRRSAIVGDSDDAPKHKISCHYRLSVRRGSLFRHAFVSRGNDETSTVSRGKSKALSLGKTTTSYQVLP